MTTPYQRKRRSSGSGGKSRDNVRPFPPSGGAAGLSPGSQGSGDFLFRMSDHDELERRLFEQMDKQTHEESRHSMQMLAIVLVLCALACGIILGAVAVKVLV